MSGSVRSKKKPNEFGRSMRKTWVEVRTLMPATDEVN